MNKERKRKAGFKYMKQRVYTAEQRADAVKLAAEIGAEAAARELKMPSNTLYAWISRAKSGDLPMSPVPPEAKNIMNLAERVKELERANKVLRNENAQIKRENEILEDAARFFANRQKK